MWIWSLGMRMCIMSLGKIIHIKFLGMRIYIMFLGMRIYFMFLGIKLICWSLPKKLLKILVPWDFPWTLPSGNPLESPDLPSNDGSMDNGQTPVHAQYWGPILQIRLLDISVIYRTKSEIMLITRKESGCPVSSILCIPPLFLSLYQWSIQEPYIMAPVDNYKKYLLILGG